MTVNEKLRILNDVEAAKFRELADMLATEQVANLIKTVNEIVFLRDMVDRVRYTTEEIYKDLDAEVTKVDNTVKAIADGSIFKDKEEPMVEQTAVEEPKVEEPKVEEAPAAPTITKDELKAKLTAYATSGVDVGGVLASMGYKNLSSVPAEKYAELLSAVEEKA